MVIPEFPTEIFDYGMLVTAPLLVYYLYKNRHLIGKEDEAKKKKGRVFMIMTFVLLSFFSLGFILIIMRYASDSEGFDNAWNLLCWLYVIGFAFGGFMIWLINYRSKHALQQK